MTTAAPSRRCIVTVVTGSWAFAAGTLLQALRRHTPCGDAAEIIVFHDAALCAGDQALLEQLGPQCRLFEVELPALRDEALRTFSALSLAKLECFRPAADYEAVLRLDADILVQDEPGEIFAYGSPALAPEDPKFSGQGATTAGINLYEPVPGFDADAPNYNSGVIVRRRDQADLPAQYQICRDFLWTHAPVLRYPDQAAFNYLVQESACRPPLYCRPASTRIRAALKPSMRRWCMPSAHISRGMTASRQVAFPNDSATMPAGCAGAAAPTRGRRQMRPIWRAALFTCCAGFARASKRTTKPLKA